MGGKGCALSSSSEEIYSTSTDGLCIGGTFGNLDFVFGVRLVGSGFFFSGFAVNALTGSPLSLVGTVRFRGLLVVD